MIAVITLAGHMQVKIDFGKGRQFASEALGAPLSADWRDATTGDGACDSGCWGSMNGRRRQTVLQLFMQGSPASSASVLNASDCSHW